MPNLGYGDSPCRRAETCTWRSFASWPAWWHQQYARVETTPRELEQDARAAKRG